jgi:hypothetical protein
MLAAAKRPSAWRRLIMATSDTGKEGRGDDADDFVVKQ